MLVSSYRNASWYFMVTHLSEGTYFQAWAFTWIRFISKLLGVLLLCLSTASQANSAEHHKRSSSDVKPKGFLSIPLADDQLGVLRILDPLCAAQLVGDAANESFISAINLEQKQQCDLRSNGRKVIHEPDRGISFSDVSKNYFVKITVIALPPRGFNLIKVSQNFGGSQSIVRYVVVTVLHGRWQTGTKKTTKKVGPYILVNSVLPSSIVDDNAAIKDSKLRIKSRH